VPGVRQRRRDLDQDGRLADAGIASHQQHRAAHQTTAGDAVELGDAGGQARSLLRLAGQRLELDQPALARGAAAARGRRRHALFDQRVPLAARIALALPAVADRAAVLADEADALMFGHVNAE
jgi:hypothetical protein